MMLRSWRVAVGIFAAVSLTACRVGPLDDAERLRSLNNAEALWRGSGIRSYQFIYTLSCFCRYRGLIDVTVSDERVIRAFVRAQRVEVPPHELTGFMSVDSLFSFVRQQSRSDPANLRVTYDRTLGYPREVFWGTPANDGGGFIGADSLLKTSGR